MRRSRRWAARCRDAFHERPGYGLFGIVQGSVSEDLRRESARALVGIGFDGYAIGGLAVGESRDEMFEATGWAAPLLPAAKPRYFMGIGDAEGVLRVIAAGIDLFGCVLPTRAARTGSRAASRQLERVAGQCRRREPTPGRWRTWPTRMSRIS